MWLGHEAHIFKVATIFQSKKLINHGEHGAHGEKIIKIIRRGHREHRGKTIKNRTRDLHRGHRGHREKQIMWLGHETDISKVATVF